MIRRSLPHLKEQTIDSARSDSLDSYKAQINSQIFPGRMKEPFIKCQTRDTPQIFTGLRTTKGYNRVTIN